MGRRKAWDASAGTCVRDILLVELVGLLELCMELPGPPNVPRALSVFNDLGEPILRRDGGVLVEGRVCEDKAEPGLCGSVEAPVPGLNSVVVFSAWNSSSSSDPTSVTCEEIVFDACCEPAVGNGLGKEALPGDRKDFGERCSVIVIHQAQDVVAFWRLS